MLVIKYISLETGMTLTTQSVKHDERVLHGKSSQHIPEYVTAENVDIPDWKFLMANNGNP